MENNALLMQIAQMLEDQTETLSKMMDSKIKAAEARINLKIENDVTKRIDSLVDGYKLTHEKQWELEKRTQDLQDQIADLQTRLAVLENKTA